MRYSHWRKSSMALCVRILNILLQLIKEGYFHFNLLDLPLIVGDCHYTKFWFRWQKQNQIMWRYRRISYMPCIYKYVRSIDHLCGTGSLSVNHGLIWQCFIYYVKVCTYGFPVCDNIAPLSYDSIVSFHFHCVLISTKRELVVWCD